MVPSAGAAGFQPGSSQDTFDRKRGDHGNGAVMGGILFSGEGEFARLRGLSAAGRLIQDVAFAVPGASADSPANATMEDCGSGRGALRRLYGGGIWAGAGLVQGLSGERLIQCKGMVASRQFQPLDLRLEPKAGLDFTAGAGAAVKSALFGAAVRPGERSGVVDELEGGPGAGWAHLGGGEIGGGFGDRKGPAHRRA